MGNVQTRQFDTRGMAHRRGSISWNFRYPTSRRREQSTMMVFNPKLSITDWLDLLDMNQYETNLQMYNCVEDILDLTDDDLKLKGIRSAAHRTKMLSSMVGVQAKRRQSMNIEFSTLPRAISKRKNSCPPIHLAELLEGVEDDISTISPRTLMRNNRSLLHKRNSVAAIRMNAGDQKRLTWNDSISQGIKSPKSGSSLDVNEIKEEEDDGSDEKDNVDILAIKQDTQNMENGSGSGIVGGNSTTAATGSATMQATNNSTISSEQQEAMALKKALEWELSLESRDLRSHAWYHGPLPRQRAEEIVQREGDFLVRDCASQPDNYVLTCCTKSAVLHFVINKILLQPETVYERVQYQFEEDAFDAVPDLITFYVGSGKPISAASGARIQNPCNRTYPLSFYGHKIVGNQLHTQMLTGMRGTTPLGSPLGCGSGFRFGSQQIEQQQQSQSHTPTSSPPHVKRNTPPRLPSKKQRSQSLTPAQAIIVSNIKADSCSSTDNIVPGNGTHSGGPFKGAMVSRRFSSLEKSSNNSSSDFLHAHAHLDHLSHNGNKIHSNGFQTIARCSGSDLPFDHVKFTTHSLPRPSSIAQGLRSNSNRISSLARDCSLDSATLDRRQLPEVPEKPPSPPPKPVRVPTLPRKERDRDISQEQQGQQNQHALHRAAVGIYQASGSDSGNGSGDSVQSFIPGEVGEFSVHRGVIIKNPRFMTNSTSSMTLKSLNEFDVVAAEAQLFTLEIPEFKPVTKFDTENFSTLLLPSVDNNPLDGDALSTFKMMLLETGPKVVAEHITRIDIGLLIEQLADDSEHNALDCCGLEMLTLPQGKVFRNDLIERTQCIKLMVAVTILTCQTDFDRAELLSKWIQVAVETKTALGNLFGFCAIMLGLCMPQVQKLDQAWHILRQKYTDSAFTFEAKLRPTLISMNECSNPQAPNTTVPHVLLYALLKDRPVMDILSINNNNSNATGNVTSNKQRSSLHNICITSWESKADDFGISIYFLHLDSVRSFLKNLNLYRKNSKIVLEESSSRLDELLSDAFRTEFHIKFLWGSKGASATPEDRHTKLEKVLTLMADKFCSAMGNNGTGTGGNAVAYAI